MSVHNVTLTASDGQVFRMRGVPADLLDFAKAQVRDDAAEAKAPKPWHLEAKVQP